MQWLNNRGNIWIDNGLWILLVSLPIGALLITLGIVFSNILSGFLAYLANVGV